jgi:hypothetical protein
MATRVHSLWRASDFPAQGGLVSFATGGRPPWLSRQRHAGRWRWLGLRVRKGSGAAFVWRQQPVDVHCWCWLGQNKQKRTALRIFSRGAQQFTRITPPKTAGGRADAASSTPDSSWMRWWTMARWARQRRDTAVSWDGVNGGLTEVTSLVGKASARIGFESQRFRAGIASCQ